MQRGMRGLIVLLALSVMLAGISYGASKPQALQVNTGTVSGVVQDSKGVIFKEASLRLMKDQTLVAETKTNKDGKYTLSNLEAGKYTLQVGDEQALGLDVVEDIKVCSLSIVVSNQENYEAASLALTQTQWVWVGVGTAGAAAVAVPTLYNTTNVFGNTPYSP